MTDEQESACADIVPAQTDDGTVSSPKNQINENNNNNTIDNSNQEQPDQKEENIEHPKDDDLVKSSNQNPNDSSQNQNNDLSNLAQEALDASQQVLGQFFSSTEKTNAQTNDEAEKSPQPIDDQETIQIDQNINDENTDKVQTNENAQPQALNTLDSVVQNSNLMRSHSANVIPEEDNMNKSNPTIFHRQISITNSPNDKSNNLLSLSNFPMQPHLSVPVMPHYNNTPNASSILSYQYQQSNALPKTVIPAISMNGSHPISPSSSILQQQQQQQTEHHHHRKKKHHSHRHQEDNDPNNNEDDLSTARQQVTKSPLSISPSDLEKILSREDDEPELDLTPQTSEALETFKKTGKLRFSLPDGLQSAISGTSSRPVSNSAESVSQSPPIIRKLQRDKVNAIIKGRYDEAKEADSLSKRVTTAVFESLEEEKRFERLHQAEIKLEEEKQIFSDVHKGCVEKLKEEEEALNQRIVSLQEIHEAEMRQFEEKWNNEDFLRRFSKPSSSLLQLKAVERSMVIAKMFDEAKVVKSRAEQLEKVETKQKQNRAEEEMKVDRKRFLDRQKKEMTSLREKCDNLLIIAKKNMEKEESPYKARISRLENIVAELKNGTEKNCKIVPSMIHTSPRGTRNELLTAKTAFKFSAYKVTSQSMKLKIKPLGCVTLKEKKKTKVSKK